ncbi:uncharacterized protein LOC142317608 [Lycorma delicatula]|uniref:uncharacterized protein LOC142317608 n=1 Tax=Lycorma delicatula TaxID=130591 RepID=UPI003F517454
MYRQIRVNDADCELQRILWRSHPEEPIKQYKLKTVTYGTAPASFLAVRSVHQLVKDEGQEFPLGSQALKQNMYVDDCLSGAATIEDASKIQNELIELLHRGGFHLRKWCSNSPSLLQNVPQSDRETQLPLQLCNEGNVKTLGILLWHPTTDKFQISFNIVGRENFTKRNILSSIAAIFDPLGLISPITILCKIFMQ